jgi:segregation and condensation protein A
VAPLSHLCSAARPLFELPGFSIVGVKPAHLAILVEVPSSQLNVHLEHYDGPLDLLLELIRKQEINIHDIPIAKITQQYLDYMQRATEANVDLSAEFVYVAATLIHIKSKMLLPRDPELEKMDPAGDDPRTELVDRLIEHERFKQAAEMLHQKRVIEEAIFSNPQMKLFEDEAGGDTGLHVSLFDLVKVFETVLERAKAKPVYEIGGDDVTVPDMIHYMRGLFKSKPGEVHSATKLFEQQTSRRGMICLFLAILELAKRQVIEFAQTELFGDIGVKPCEGWERELDAADSLKSIEQDYK